MYICRNLLFFCISTIGFSLQAQSEIDSLESILELEMTMKSTYDNKKELKIEAYKTIAANPDITENQRVTYYSYIINEFEKYSFDSTLAYIKKIHEQSLRINDKFLDDQSKLFLSAALGNAGRSKEAEDVLKQINTENLKGELLISYCNTARKLFEDLSYYAISENNKEQYRQLYRYYKDSLLALVDAESEISLSLKEKELLDDRKLDESLMINSKRMAKTQIGTKKYSLITFQRSLIYQLKGDKNLQKKFLILSAISDIRGSIKDNASLASLASLLYEDQEIEKSYKYIQNAYQDAITYNSRLRFLEISKILSLITAAYQKKSDTQTRMLQKNLVIISLLSFVLLITVLLIYRQVKKLSHARNELKNANLQLNSANANLTNVNERLERLNLSLSESDHVKEQYIANFLNIQSEYIDKIDRYQKLVKKMLVARKFDELLKQVSSQEYIDTEVKSFYHTFDQAFLSIYPNFISKLNELLEPAGRIELKEDEKLNTELRIFALIRLGIKDSSNIARLLRYSVNTIYNYRVRIKNKSIVPREEFELHVERINATQNNSAL